MPALLAENVLAFLIERALRRQVRWYRRKFSVLICVSCTYKDFFIFRSLILAAVLLAAGAVLKFFAGSVINIGGMKPNFIIAMYCLAILRIRPSLPRAAVIGVHCPRVVTLSNRLADLTGGALAADLDEAEILVREVLA